MLEIAVLGAGRIGRIHAGNIAAHPDARLAGVADTVPAAAAHLAMSLGARVLSVDDALRADAVRQLENPEAYKNVPRRTLGRDGRIRPWTPPGGRSPPGSPRAYPKPELLAAALSGQ